MGQGGCGLGGGWGGGWCGAWYLYVFCIIVRGGSRIYYIFYYKTTKTIFTWQRGRTNHSLRDAKSNPEATVTSSSITEGGSDGSSRSDTSTSARKFMNQSLRASVAMARTLRRT